MPRYLITGATGYLGQGLIGALIADPGNHVHGVVRRLHAPPQGWLPLFGDVLSLNWQNMLADIRPDVIVHLASAPRHADLDTQMTVTVGSTHALLEGVCQARIKPRLFIPGSAAEYGSHPAPITETAPCLPVTVYGMAKFIQTQLARQYAQEHHLPVVIGRVFNVYGQTPIHYPIADWAGQIARMEAGGSLSHTISTRNMQAIRDFVHREDVIDAILALIRHGKAGEIYNIGSGKSISLQAAFDTLVDCSLRRYLTAQPEGPQFEDICVADIQKITQDTGWLPKHTLAEGLKDELAYWRHMVKTGQVEPKRQIAGGVE